MQQLKRIASIFGYLLFFCLYFYLLLINLFFSLSQNNANILLALFAAFAVSVLLPGIICWQHYHISKLERKITELEAFHSNI